MHINRFKTGLVHDIRCFNVRVNTLLAQDRYAWSHTASDERCRYILGHIKTDMRRDTGVGLIQQAVILGIGTGRVVAQTSDTPAGLAPETVQGSAWLLVNDFGIARELDHMAIIQFADDMAARAQTMLAQHIHRFRFLLSAYLNYCTEFFREQST